MDFLIQTLQTRNSIFLRNSKLANEPLINSKSKTNLFKQRNVYFTFVCKYQNITKICFSTDYKPSRTVIKQI